MCKKIASLSLSLLLSLIATHLYSAAEAPSMTVKERAAALKRAQQADADSVGAVTARVKRTGKLVMPAPVAGTAVVESKSPSPEAVAAPVAGGVKARAAALAAQAQGKAVPMPGQQLAVVRGAGCDIADLECLKGADDSSEVAVAAPALGLASFGDEVAARAQARGLGQAPEIVLPAYTGRTAGEMTAERQAQEQAAKDRAKDLNLILEAGVAAKAAEAARAADVLAEQHAGAVAIQKTARGMQGRQQARSMRSEIARLAEVADADAAAAEAARLAQLEVAAAAELAPVAAPAPVVAPAPRRPSREIDEMMDWANEPRSRGGFRSSSKSPEHTEGPDGIELKSVAERTPAQAGGWRQWPMVQRFARAMERKYAPGWHD